ncbi:hypothetical protein RYH73_18145 [Olivibacter sp. CPCC 100613]|uniref:hypothetical protein n=1 Tax=Olivibacter sp. CPCC 100613 TaxID=3079931 RepID=UPI002FF9F0F5
MSAVDSNRPTFKKYLWWAIFIILIIFAGFFYFRYYYVFGEGVKSGYLNFAVKKGNIFKTYEGKLIQEGFGKSAAKPGIASYEFEFSVESDSVFKTLEMNSGKYFDLHYKEYHGILPWRGNTQYVVDKVIGMR